VTAIRRLEPGDWPQVQAIYAAGIATGNATFESEPPDWEHFDAGKAPGLRLVAETDGAVTGWIAASPVSARPVYRGVVEHSVYVAPSAAGQGLGRLLLDAFLRAADDAGYWTVQSSIFPENEASLRLHRGAGFREVGRRERIALMTYGPWAGQWRDTILIERRRADA
jgi:phosphinothricin acetyltransferase